MVGTSWSVLSTYVPDNSKMKMMMTIVMMMYSGISFYHVRPQGLHQTLAGVAKNGVERNEKCARAPATTGFKKQPRTYVRRYLRTPATTGYVRAYARAVSRHHGVCTYGRHYPPELAACPGPSSTK